MRLALPAALHQQIVAEARAAFPKECCGLIEGMAEGEDFRAFALYPARNIAGEADRFEIHPEDHFAALRHARGTGCAIIGCYHSHPGGAAQPSAHDRAGADEENFLWLIAALAAPDAPVDLAAFRYSAADFFDLALSEALGADLVTSSSNTRN